MSGCRHVCRIELLEGGRGAADPPDLLALAAAAPSRTPLFYWERPAMGEAILGVGCAHDVRTSGTTRLGEAARQVRSVLASTDVSRADGITTETFVAAMRPARPTRPSRSTRRRAATTATTPSAA